MRQIHRAGEKTFIDFSGIKPHLVDPDTGEIQPVGLFVGALGASSFTYAEATLSQQLEPFIAAHIHMFEFFGGASSILVPDQLKSGVPRPSRYEPGIHRTYEEMAHHYGAVVIPARPGKPRDKAKAEAAVLLAQRWILAALRDRVFFSLGEINQAIRELLVVFNNRPMQKLGVSRRELFEQLERPALHPLPADRYEIGRWKTCTVSIDYHIEVEHNYYSVPFPLIKEIVEARFTRSTVEIVHKSKRITSHQRLYGRGKHSTKSEHMPASHRAHAEWSPSRLISWAQKSGPATGRLVTCILQSRPHPEQGYRACLGIMRLGRTYGYDRLEAASQRALDLDAGFYRTIKNILASGADRLALEEDRLEQTAPHHDNIRGADYYESQPETNRKEIPCSTKQPSRR
jgi:transposase